MSFVLALSVGAFLSQDLAVELDRVMLLCDLSAGIIHTYPPSTDVKTVSRLLTVLERSRS